MPLATRRHDLPLVARLMPVQNFQRDAGEAPQGEAAGATSGKPARFEVVFTTGARVERYDYLTGRRYLEELVITPESVNLDRLQRGAPLLNTHSSWSLDAVLGVCANPRIVNGRGIVDVTLSRRAAVAGIVQDLVDGILRNVSVGYSRDRMEKIPPAKEGDPWVYRVTRLTPYEVSICPMGADMDAHVGAAKREADRTFPCEIVELNTRGDAAPHHGDPMDPEEIQRREEAARVAERARIADIRNRCRTAKLGDEFAQRLIDENVSGADIAARVLDAWATRQEKEGTSRSEHRGASRGPNLDDPRVEYNGGREDEFRKAVVDGLLLREGLPVAKPHPGARDFKRTSLVEVARACLSIAGHRARGMFGGDGPQETFERAMSSSDFPGILRDTAGKAMRIGYEEEPSSHAAWVRETSSPDFKTQYRPILGSAPALDKVNEGGEYKFGALSDDEASFALVKYGKITHLTWEAMVNDDMNAFARIPLGLAQSARRLEADSVYSLVSANSGAGQTMQDGTALFHASHNNLHGTPVAFDAAALSLAKVLMRRQTALGGGLMNLTPKFLLVAPEREQAALELLNKSALTKTTALETPMPGWIADLTLVVEPRLATNAFWLLANQASIDTCELSFLDGEARPYFETREGFEVDGMQIKIRHVFAAKFLDWRGAVKVPLS